MTETIQTQEPARAPDVPHPVAIDTLLADARRASRMETVFTADLPSGVSVKVMWWNGATECEVRVRGDTVDLRRLSTALELAQRLVSELHSTTAYDRAPADLDDTPF